MIYRGLRKQSTSTYPLFFMLISSTDHITGATSISPTVTISKNGGTFATPSGAITEVAVGWYKIAGNTTDSNTLGELFVHATGTGCDPSDCSYAIIASDPFDANLGLTNLDAAISTRSTFTSATAVTVATNNDKTGYALTQTFPTNFSSLAISVTTGAVTVGTNNDKTGYALSVTPPTAQQVADATLDTVTEGTWTLRKILRIIMAVFGGKSSGGGTGVDTFRDVGDTKNRVTATVDINGNRSAMTLDGN